MRGVCLFEPGFNGLLGYGYLDGMRFRRMRRIRASVAGRYRAVRQCGARIQFARYAVARRFGVAHALLRVMRWTRLASMSDMSRVLYARYDSDMRAMRLFTSLTMRVCSSYASDPVRFGTPCRADIHARHGARRR